MSNNSKQILQIELNPQVGQRWEKADFAIRVNGDTRELKDGDVVSFYTSPHCKRPLKINIFPDEKFEEVKKNLPDGLRAMIGNAGCELTFRHIAGLQPRQRSELLIDWGNRALEHLGSRVVFGVMDMDIIYDAVAGGEYLHWAGKYKVPLVIFCGYRFLFKPTDFSHIAHVTKTLPFESKLLDYPYEEISTEIKKSGAEVWVGAGFHEGLALGVMERAEAFGIKGILTSRKAWETGLKIFEEKAGIENGF